MNNQLMTIEAELKCPIISNGFLTLDALLYVAMEQSGMAHEDILDAMPLERHDSGVFMGSAGFFWEMPEYADHGFVRGMRNMDAAPLSLGRGEKIAKIDRKRAFRPRLSEYVTEYASGMLWFARGDIDKVKSIISTLMGIGKKTNQGYGEVIGWTASPVDYDCSMVLKNGDPSRPLPDGVVSRGLLKSSPLIPPYFGGEPVLCRVPQSRLIKQGVHF